MCEGRTQFSPQNFEVGRLTTLTAEMRVQAQGGEAICPKPRGWSAADLTPSLRMNPTFSTCAPQGSVFVDGNTELSVWRARGRRHRAGSRLKARRQPRRATGRREDGRPWQECLAGVLTAEEARVSMSSRRRSASPVPVPAALSKGGFLTAVPRGPLPQQNTEAAARCFWKVFFPGQAGRGGWDFGS